MPRGDDPFDDQILEPLDLVDDGRFAFAEPTARGGRPSASDAEDDATRSAAATLPRYRRATVIVAIVVAIAAIAATVAAIAQSDPGPPAGSAARESGLTSTTRARTTTAVVDDARPPTEVGIFGAGVQTRGTAIVGGTHGLRTVDLATGAVATDPAATGSIGVVAATADTVFVLRQATIAVRDGARGPFVDLDAPTVVIGSNGDYWLDVAGDGRQLTRRSDRATVDTDGLKVVGATRDHLVGVRSADDAVVAQDLATGRRTPLGPSGTHVLAVGSTRVALASDRCAGTCTVTVVDLVRDERIDWITLSGGASKSIAFSPDDERLAISTYDVAGTLTMIDLRTGTRVAGALPAGRFRFSASVQRQPRAAEIAWTPDSQGFVLASTAGLAHLAFGATHVTPAVAHFVSARSVAILGPPTTNATPRPLARERAPAPVVPGAIGTLVGIDSDGTQFVAVDLVTGATRTVALEFARTDGTDATGATAGAIAYAPTFTRVGEGWLVTSGGFGWYVGDGAVDAQLLGPLSAAHPAPRGGAWTFLQVQGRPGVEVRRFEGGRLGSVLATVHGAFGTVADPGILVTIQTDPTVAPRLVAFDPETGITTEVAAAVNPQTLGLAAAGTTVVISDFEAGVSAIVDTRTGARTAPPQGLAIQGVAAISASGRRLVAYTDRGLVRVDLDAVTVDRLPGDTSDGAVAIADDGLVVVAIYGGGSAPVAIVLPDASTSVVISGIPALGAIALGRTAPG